MHQESGIAPLKERMEQLPGSWLFFTHCSLTGNGNGQSKSLVFNTGYPTAGDHSKGPILACSQEGESDVYGTI